MIWANGERVGDRINLDFELSPGVMFLGRTNLPPRSRVEFDRVRIWPSTKIRQILAESGALPVDPSSATQAP